MSAAGCENVDVGVCLNKGAHAVARVHAGGLFSKNV